MQIAYILVLGLWGPREERKKEKRKKKKKKLWVG